MCFHDLLNHFNPIEYLLPQLNKRVPKRHPPPTTLDHSQNVTQEWQRIPHNNEQNIDWVCAEVNPVRSHDDKKDILQLKYMFSCC